MTDKPSTTRPRTILYVAALEATASDGADRLERVEGGGPPRSVRPATTVERVENWAPAVDCVVFAETPTTAAGSNLHEMIDACGSTPLVLFTDPSFSSAAARSTDGIDGYVRRDTDDAMVHLADEIEWVCRGRVAESNSDVIALAGAQEPADAEPAERLLESASKLAACRDREQVFEVLVETAADALDHEQCWLSTVQFGTFEPRVTASGVSDDDLEAMAREGVLDEILETGDAICVADLARDDRLAAPLAGVESLCCVPVDDIGILQVAADEPDAFDERDGDTLTAWAELAATVLARLDTEASSDAERERLRQGRDYLQAERTRLGAARDRLRTVVAALPEPAVWYDLEDGKPVVRAVTDAFADVFETDPDAIIGEPVAERLVPSGLEHRQRTLCEALQAGERDQFERRHDTADGIREFRVTVVPLEAATNGGDGDTDTDPAGLLVYDDVTDLHRHARARAATAARLETIADLVDDEVWPPLNVARSSLELAVDTGAEEHAAAVRDAHERVRTQLDRLAAIATRDERVDTEPVAVHDIAQQAWLSVDTGETQLVTPTAKNRVLEANKTQLRALFEHLFRHVIEEDETAPAVTVTATNERFTVVQHDRATNTKTIDDLETASIAPEATGVDLEVVERIADAHGWTVDVVDADGRIGITCRGVDAGDGF